MLLSVCNGRDAMGVDVAMSLVHLPFCLSYSLDSRHPGRAFWSPLRAVMIKDLLWQHSLWAAFLAGGSLSGPTLFWAGPLVSSSLSGLTPFWATLLVGSPSSWLPSSLAAPLLGSPPGRNREKKRGCLFMCVSVSFGFHLPSALSLVVRGIVAPSG